VKTERRLSKKLKIYCCILIAHFHSIQYGMISVLFVFCELLNTYILIPTWSWIKESFFYSSRCVCVSWRKDSSYFLQSPFQSPCRFVMSEIVFRTTRAYRFPFLRLTPRILESWIRKTQVQGTGARGHPHCHFCVPSTCGWLMDSLV